MPDSAENKALYSIEDKGNGVTVVKITDALALFDQEKIIKLSNELSALITTPPPRGTKLIIDVSKATNLSKGGIGVFLILRSKLQPTGSLVLAGIRKDVEKVLRETGLNNFFPTANNVEAAITISTTPEL